MIVFPRSGGEVLPVRPSCPSVGDPRSGLPARPAVVGDDGRSASSCRGCRSSSEPDLKVRAASARARASRRYGCSEIERSLELVILLSKVRRHEDPDFHRTRPLLRSRGRPLVNRLRLPGSEALAHGVENSAFVFVLPSWSISGVPWPRPRRAGSGLSQDPDPVEVGFFDEELLLAGRRTIDVHRRKSLLSTSRGPG